MRGLVVLAGIVLIALLLSNFGSAQSKPTVSVTEPPTITCTLDRGTTISIKAPIELRNVEIGNLCRKDSIPKGWTVYCHTSDTLKAVTVNFVMNGRAEQTQVVCS